MDLVLQLLPFQKAKRGPESHFGDHIQSKELSDPGKVYLYKDFIG